MIHGAQLMVTCDGTWNGKRCSERVFINLYGSSNSSGSVTYETSYTDVEKRLLDFDWSIRDGLHLCEMCSNPMVEHDAK